MPPIVIRCTLSCQAAAQGCLEKSATRPLRSDSRLCRSTAKRGDSRSHHHPPAGVLMITPSLGGVGQHENCQCVCDRPLAQDDRPGGASRKAFAAGTATPPVASRHVVRIDLLNSPDRADPLRHAYALLTCLGIAACGVDRCLWHHARSLHSSSRSLRAFSTSSSCMIIRGGTEWAGSLARKSSSRCCSTLLLSAHDSMVMSSRGHAQETHQTAPAGRGSFLRLLASAIPSPIRRSSE